MSKDEKIDNHPSYGMASFVRTTGGIGPLFGSPLPNHNSCISLYVRHAEVQHGLSTDWHHAFGPSIVEIQFSNAQFAELLTTMNQGDGVPCTLKAIEGKSIPSPRHIVPEHEKITAGFEEKIADVTKSVSDLVDSVKARFKDKKPLTVADKDEIVRVLNKLKQELDSNAPFVVKQFGEAAAKVVTSAKAEIAAAVISMAPGATARGQHTMSQAEASLALPSIERRRVCEQCGHRSYSAEEADAHAGPNGGRCAGTSSVT